MKGSYLVQVVIFLICKPPIGAPCRIVWSGPLTQHV